MNQIPLITSLPPRMSRKSSQGRELGDKYAGLCIESWWKSDFAPVSINSKREVGLLTKRSDIDYLVTSEDGEDIVGKPLVYLKDMLITAKTRSGNGLAALANADVILDLDECSKRFIRKLQPGECLVAKRTDINDLDQRVGSEYSSGYDFFAFHTSDIGDDFEGDFIFGAPWWDHYFPIYMSLKGIKLVSAISPFVYHLNHQERWDWSSWLELGATFVRNMERRGLTQSLSIPGQSYFKTFGSAIELRSLNVRSRIQSLVRGRSANQQEYIDRLRRLSDINVKFIEGQRRRF